MFLITSRCSRAVLFPAAAGSLAQVSLLYDPQQLPPTCACYLQIGWAVAPWHSRDGQPWSSHRLLHPQDLGMEMSHSPLSVVRPPRPHQQESKHSWLARKTPMARTASRKKTKWTDGSSRSPPSSSLTKRPHLAVRLVEQRRPRTPDFRARIAPCA